MLLMSPPCSIWASPIFSFSCENHVLGCDSIIKFISNLHILWESNTHKHKMLVLEFIIINGLLSVF